MTLAERLAGPPGPIVADGAIGTELHFSSGAGGLPHAEPTARLNIESPDLVLKMHRAYLAAGASLLTTNTFCANAYMLPADDVAAVNARAVALARAAIAGQSQSANMLVFGSSGPVPPSPDCQSIYRQQFTALAAGGVDAIHLETVRSLGSAQAAVAVHGELRQADSQTPELVISYSPVDERLSLADVSLDEFLAWVTAQQIAGLGVNCGDGGVWLHRCLTVMRARYTGPLLAMPSVGRPSAGGGYPRSPERWVAQLTSWQREFDLAIVGGCCGTGPDHIRQLVAAIEIRE